MSYPMDCTERLGIQKMPPGYRLWLLDSGHYMWEKADIEESAIHWKKWEVYRWAWNDYRSKPRLYQFGHMADQLPFIGDPLDVSRD